MKRADLEWEWKEVIRGLESLQQVEANFQGRRFVFRSQLTAHASQAVRATGVAIPPTYANSSDSVRVENVVPRHFCPYVSSSAPTI